MTDQNSQFFAILTAVGEAKQANAAALGTSWTFAQMGVGDANGNDPIPDRTQTKLINERRRAPLNQVKVDPTNASVIIAEQIIPENVGGWWVRELALYDADGDMVAVANCAPTFKPLLSQGSGRTQVIRINLIVSSTSNIELKIDPSVVLATREYVDTSVIEALARLDFKHSVLVATTANIALSGIQTVDGVLLTVDARVLVKDQAQAKDNGIYVVPANGAWKRAQDADASIEVTPGLFVSVEKGTANGDSVWQLVTDAPIVLGTTPLTFEVVASRTGIVAGTYRSLTVDKLGRVIAGTNPTTLAGYQISDAYKRTDVDFLLSGKANNAITLAGYGIGDAYTKTAVDDFLTGKANKATTLGGYGISDAYTKTETNALLNAKVSIASSGISGVAPLITGPLAGVPSSQLYSAVSPGTTDTPPSYPNTVGMHFIFANTSFGADIGISLNDNIGNLLFRNLGPNASGWRKVWHDGNFALSSKISGDNCPIIGFNGPATAPYMRHTDGTYVALQIDRPKDTANFSASGFSKNADTGEIIQWMEVAIGDIPAGGKTIDITWPFAFPNAIVNVPSIALRSVDAATRHVSTGYYSMATINGCRLQIDEAAQQVQPASLTAIVTARGR
ncbi:phage tail protein [Pseudomonas sp. MAFF 301514]|uniref:Phage tail protein n=1 Tax=Pseudomonas allii TaxID=2740531 RepID=A0A7Y8UX39_9PSED|nr:phage tail protein [Pseudomonas allii]NWN46912.1 phage tail protein [Pseudomonas allii]NWN60650.1 phage tail protein [Pseudomonas allii]